MLQRPVSAWPALPVLGAVHNRQAPHDITIDPNFCLNACDEQAGFHSVLSAPYYLNYISYGMDWVKYYQTEPTNYTGGAKAEQDGLLGGIEACFWSEYIDSTNFIARAWPRVAAVAERAWSDKSVVDVAEAQARIHDFRCKLLDRVRVRAPNPHSVCPPWLMCLTGGFFGSSVPPLSRSAVCSTRSAIDSSCAHCDACKDVLSSLWACVGAWLSACVFTHARTSVTPVVRGILHAGTQCRAYWDLRERRMPDKS